MAGAFLVDGSNSSQKLGRLSARDFIGVFVKYFKLVHKSKLVFGGGFSKIIEKNSNTESGSLLLKTIWMMLSMNIRMTRIF